MAQLIANYANSFCCSVNSILSAEMLSEPSCISTQVKLPVRLSGHVPDLFRSNPTGVLRRGRKVGVQMQEGVRAQVDINAQQWDRHVGSGRSLMVDFLGRIRVTEELGAEAGNEDWRTFRARLCNTSVTGATSNSPGHGESWAHEITRLEEGCILMATHQLDGHPLLHRSVVLLTDQVPSEGDINAASWTGVLMNKRLPYPVAQVQGMENAADVALSLGACSAFLGGSLLTMSPCESPSFHTISPLPLHGHRALRTDLRVGTGDSALLSAWAGIQRKLILPGQVRVHVGQLNWDSETLGLECDVLQWWQILSCSSSLLLSDNVDCMWDSIRLLLGQNMQHA